MKIFPRPRSAFTLIELLVVIAIIAVLAALILNVAGVMQQKAARSRAATEIAAISTALESFKADNGDYPTNSDGTTPASTINPSNNTNLYVNLATTNNGAGRVYLPFQQKMISTNGANVIITDPFGNAYGYYYMPTNVNGRTANAGWTNGVGAYDLWSTSGNPTNPALWNKNW